ncbi:phosphoribosylglycinamide formyltransferase [Apilactobacillus xinyiensis]|uniref:phosphoribosylglycinamide formyltransferase n=2 Tax=Apilactobacillus xinyiensis TaxID=2841032 RepID=UPI00200E5B79|nr:phosphoribosylglycinamide formyltransferase [Apilactobacillus xinyiensis]MCL0329538.1 phosphoribosylglycinamide formyltransferase [Apilactobacillus xinyiensis]
MIMSQSQSLRDNRLKKVAIFASGNGTNFEAIVNAELPIKVSLLVCDHSNANVVQRAKNHGIPVLCVNFRDFDSKAAAEKFILNKLLSTKIDFIILAGYMRIVSPVLLDAYPKKILNLHPALLPKFPGRHGIEDAYNAGVETTGVTVHFVDAGIDTGKIIAQQSVPRLADDKVEDLENRIHKVEHVLYPKTILDLINRGEI